MSVNPKNIQLKGSNLCNMDCTNKDSVIYPETSIQQVLTGGSQNQTLRDWIIYDHHNEEPLEGGIYRGLLEWLETNYTISYTLPAAAYAGNPNPSLGGVIVDPAYLTVDNEGVLSLNVESLPYIGEATATKSGIIKLGNDTELPNDFTNTEIIDSNIHTFPLRVDSNGRAGIAIEDSLYTPVQSNWLEDDESSPSYILDKPDINNSTITIKQGGITKGIFTLNQNSNTEINLEASPVTSVDDVRSSSISSHNFEINKHSIPVNVGVWVPLVEIRDANLTSSCITTEFEIIGRADGSTYYGRYLLNHRTNVDTKLICLDFYSNSSKFSYNDIEYYFNTTSAYTNIILIKKNYSLPAIDSDDDDVFTVNIISEAGYGTRTYYGTDANSQPLPETINEQNWPTEHLYKVVSYITDTDTPTPSSGNLTINVKANTKYLYNIHGANPTVEKVIINSVEDSRFESTVVIYDYDSQEETYNTLSITNSPEYPSSVNLDAIVGQMPLVSYKRLVLTFRQNIMYINYATT